MNLLNFD